VVDVIEQPPDVELKYPIVPPAPLARDSDGVKRRFSRPIAVRVRQKYWVQVRLNELLDDHLSHSICHGGTPKIRRPPDFFGMETARTGGGK
jgi:hypothetical protein